ncbi:MAG: hypothetical protein IKN17_03355 [Ruminococcus sp.]|nr:hypothetical protein [Ruminococcus sp.]
MKSDVITVSSKLEGKEEALKAAERFCSYHGISGKNAMTLRLLTEETVCMIHGILDDFSGRFWIDSENVSGGLMCRLHLSADKPVAPAQETQLLGVSTSGKNESARGILGKIRDAFRVSMQYSGDGTYMNEYTAMNAWYSLGMNHTAGTTAGYMDQQMWSLTSYRSNIASGGESEGEQWDELEKSIIAKLADDVKVWFKKTTTDVVIEKLLK